MLRILIRLLQVLAVLGGTLLTLYFFMLARTGWFTTIWLAGILFIWPIVTLLCLRLGRHVSPRSSVHPTTTVAGR